VGTDILNFGTLYVNTVSLPSIGLAALALSPLSTECLRGGICVHDEPSLDTLQLNNYKLYNKLKAEIESKIKILIFFLIIN
jgi:hypothetical protein